jgi:hypothetical protein
MFVIYLNEKYSLSFFHFPFLIYVYISNMGATTKSPSNNNDSMQIIAHQLGFLLTGLCTTLGVQWLFYRGAASM